jgi:predicted dehydrogenase
VRGIGVIGTGDIAEVYLRNAAVMRNYRIVGVASRDLDRTKRRAAAWNVEALPVEDMLRRDDIEIILNLTPPAAHFATTMAAPSAGKHVFSEKPLAVTSAESTLLAEEATRRGLRLAVAPDSMLGAGVQKARAMIDAGFIGKPLMATAAILYHGAESWHPNPSFFYHAAGGGPIHDVGPYFLSALAILLGPIARMQATGFKGFATRMVTAPGPEQGHVIPVEVFTSVLALATFRSGVEAALMASWDVWQNSQPDLEVHGTDGSLSLPHPNWHGGPLRYARAGGTWEDVPLTESPLACPTGRRRTLGVPTIAASASPRWSRRLMPGSPIAPPPNLPATWSRPLMVSSPPHGAAAPFP